MKSKILKWAAALMVSLMGPALHRVGAATAATPDDPTPKLSVGDPAPKLQNGRWAQGDPVKGFANDKTYIVEFWATWCGPCRVSIPHLNEVYNKYKDKGLVVIGQDCWEHDESLVDPFIKKMGDKMTYRVALDDKNGSETGKMAETWMAAAGQNGIPTAFIVNKDGKVAWIGHPMTLTDDVIDQILDGKYDLKKAAADYATARVEKEKTQKEMAGKQNELMKLSAAFSRHMKNKEWDQADETIKELENTVPESQRSAVGALRFQVLLAKGDSDGAAKFASDQSDTHKDNAQLQNSLAWMLLTSDGLSQNGLDTAEKIASRANDATDGKNPTIMDTLARAWFMQGKKDKAIELQTKAVQLAESDTKDELQKTLDSYKAGKLPKAQAPQ
jgi:thiol-disulfide isomerase/thioredoxin